MEVKTETKSAREECRQMHFPILSHARTPENALRCKLGNTHTHTHIVYIYINYKTYINIYNIYI